jgi:hypothetical protein
LDRLGLALQLAAQAIPRLAAGDAVVDLGHRHQGEPPDPVAQQLEGGGGGGGALRRPVDAHQDVHRAAAGVAAGHQPRPPGTLVPDLDQGQQQPDRSEQQAEQPPGEGAEAEPAHHQRQHEPDAGERRHQQRQERGG